MQLSYAQIPRWPHGMINLEKALSFVAPEVREAMIAAAAQLEHLGIRHALAGGLAVGAHGYVRATSDVDFLVGDEAFEQQGLLVTFKPGVPIQIGSIKIDYLTTTSLGKHLEATLSEPLRSNGLAIVPIEVLIYMKLVAKRRKDQLDVVELLKGGVDLDKIRAYLQDYGADLVPLFDRLSTEAEAEI
jgi:hypothetical protein